MGQTELDKIIDQGEGIRIEFKEAQNGVPASLYDTVCSFLNHEGGIILLGVKDDGTILGLSEQNLKNLKQDIVTALNNPDVLSPIFPLPVEEVVHPNGTILYIRVPLSSFVHKHKNIIYDRENDSDFRVTDEARIGDLYARKRNVFTENKIFPHLQITDLDRSLFDKVRSRLALVNANHPWLEASNERILRDARLLRTDFVEPKSPNIRALFNVLTWADEIGSGVKNMNKFVVAYTGGTHPIVIEDESFRSVIPMVTYLVEENYQFCLHLTHLTKDQLKQKRIEQFKGFSLIARLKNVEDWDKLAITLGGSWEEKKGKLRRKNYLTMKVFTKFCASKKALNKPTESSMSSLAPKVLTKPDTQ